MPTPSDGHLHVSVAVVGPQERTGPPGSTSDGRSRSPSWGTSRWRTRPHRTWQVASTDTNFSLEVPDVPPVAAPPPPTAASPVPAAAETLPPSVVTPRQGRGAKPAVQPAAPQGDARGERGEGADAEAWDRTAPLEEGFRRAADDLSERLCRRIDHMEESLERSIEQTLAATIKRVLGAEGPELSPKAAHGLRITMPEEEWPPKAAHGLHATAPEAERRPPEKYSAWLKGLQDAAPAGGGSPSTCGGAAASRAAANPGDGFCTPAHNELTPGTGCTPETDENEAVTKSGERTEPDTPCSTGTVAGMLPFTTTGRARARLAASARAGAAHVNGLRQSFVELTSDESKASAAMPMTPLQWLKRSRYFEWWSGILIILNATFIGWQTQYNAERAEADAALGRPLQIHTPAGFLALHTVFCVLFSIELGLRWVCEGFRAFFQTTDKWWNLFDLVIVLASWFDLLLQFIVGEDEDPQAMGNLSVLRVVRVFRVVRITRIIRVMRFFRELRMMVNSIIGSCKYLMWVILILLLTFYLFGITFTAATITHLDTTALWLDPDTKDLRWHFGTVDRSILSLFMAMSGGNDWGFYYAALRVLPWQYKLLFLLFITFAIFAVVNIVTGVFVESAMQLNSLDRDIIVDEELEAKKAYLHSMRAVFEEMDLDCAGYISLEQFESRLGDERIKSYFDALKLDVSDARTVFRLLDFDQSNEVNLDEFLSGCYRLQGESRNLDLKIMQCEVRFLQESFLAFSNTLNDMHSHLIGMNAPTPKMRGARSREPLGLLNPGRKPTAK